MDDEASFNRRVILIGTAATAATTTAVFTLVPAPNRFPEPGHKVELCFRVLKEVGEA